MQAASPLIDIVEVPTAAPPLTKRSAVLSTCAVTTQWAQLAWLARALNKRKLAGANCAGDLGMPTVRMLG